MPCGSSRRSSGRRWATFTSRVSSALLLFAPGLGRLVMLISWAAAALLDGRFGVFTRCSDSPADRRRRASSSAAAASKAGCCPLHFGPRRGSPSYLIVAACRCTQPARRSSWNMPSLNGRSNEASAIAPSHIFRGPRPGRSPSPPPRGSGFSASMPRHLAAPAPPAEARRRPASSRLSSPVRGTARGR